MCQIKLLIEKKKHLKMDMERHLNYTAISSLIEGLSLQNVDASLVQQKEMLVPYLGHFRKFHTVRCAIKFAGLDEGVGGGDGGTRLHYIFYFGAVH